MKILFLGLMVFFSGIVKAQETNTVGINNGNAATITDLFIIESFMMHNFGNYEAFHTRIDSPYCYIEETENDGTIRKSIYNYPEQSTLLFQLTFMGLPPISIPTSISQLRLYLDSKLKFVCGPRATDSTFHRGNPVDRGIIDLQSDNGCGSLGSEILEEKMRSYRIKEGINEFRTNVSVHQYNYFTDQQLSGYTTHVLENINIEYRCMINP